MAKAFNPALYGVSDETTVTINQQEEQLRAEWIKALKDDSMFMEDVYEQTADWWLEKLTHQLTELGKEIKELYQDEHPVDCIDGETPVETYGYEATHNQALKAVLALLSQRGIKID